MAHIAVDKTKQSRKSESLNDKERSRVELKGEERNAQSGYNSRLDNWQQVGAVFVLRLRSLLRFYHPVGDTRDVPNPLSCY